MDLALIQAVSIPPEEELAHVAPLFYEPIYALVRKDSGIETIEQLSGLPVLLGEPGTGSRACVELMIKTLPKSFGKIQILSGKWILEWERKYVIFGKKKGSMLFLEGERKETRLK